MSQGTANKLFGQIGKKGGRGSGSGLPQKGE